MDEMNRTIIDTNGGWGAGLGGLIGSWIGNGWGGFGGWNRGNAGVGYDTGAINAIQEQLGNVQTQIANAMAQQTQAIINALKPTTTTGA